MINDMGSAIGVQQNRIESEARVLSQTAAAASSEDSVSQQGQDSVSFASALKEAIHGVDQQQRSASDKMEAVDSGTSDDLVGAMLSSQKASLSFSMLMQVRNKIAGAMDELLKLSL